MGRIEATFAKARQERRGLVMPFLTAGDPSIPVTIELLAALERAGAAAVELGIPFSDPIADGPVIAASMHEALVRGVTPKGIMDALAAFRGPGATRDREAGHGAGTPARPGATLPAVAMVSVSIVHRMGADRFIDDLERAGLDGIIAPDSDLATAESLARLCERRGLSCSFLVAPTSTPERVRQIVGLCRGFVYLLARAGVTGETPASTGAQTASPDLRRQADCIRAVNAAIPIAAGFGIATPEQVRATLDHVDGAIVGSALVRRIGDAVRAGRNPVDEAERFVASLVAAARR